ncbi:MAG: hypothetical protein ACI9UV_000692, partial [Algoriphagus sp.]
KGYFIVKVIMVNLAFRIIFGFIFVIDCIAKK